MYQQQHCSRMYGTQWDSHIGINNLVKVVGTEQLSFEPIKLPYNNINNVTTTVQTPLAFGANETQEYDEVPAWCLEYFPKITDPPMLICQASGDNFTNTIKQDGTTSHNYSVAESFLSRSSDSHSSKEEEEEEEEYSNFQPSFYDHDKLLGSYTAAADESPLECSLQRNQLNSCTKPENQSPRHYGIACVTSSNSSSKRALTGKRRIRWTKDLHEPFMLIVDSLGGPEKAKPKAILDMMKSDLLSISHVKSHLQKCRSTTRMHKPLQELSEERHRTEFDGITELQVKILTQIEESRQLQLEIRRSISQQLEMQRSLEMLITQERKKLKVMLDIRQKKRPKLKKTIETELEVTVLK